MLPTLSIGSIALPTYPLFLLVALWIGMGVSAARARQFGLDGDHVYNAGLYGLIAGVLGARIWFVLSHWENYASDLTQAFSLSRSALSAGEGLIVAGVVVLIYLQRHQVPVGLFLDAIAPGTAIALFIGHVGAFLGGVGLGMPSNVSWAIEIGNTARHPVQLYEAAAGLMIFGILYGLRGWQPWPGVQFWLLVGWYSLARLILEIFHHRPAIVGDGFLATQIIALAGLVLTLAVMAYNFRSSSTEVDVEQYELVK